MKKATLILIFIAIFSFVSCNNINNNANNRAIEEGKIAYVSKEYDKAISLFKYVISEDENNQEAKSLLELAENYNKLLEYVKKSELEEVNSLIEKIEKNKNINLVKEELEEVKKNISEQKEFLKLHLEEINKIEQNINEGQLDLAKENLLAKRKEIKGHINLEGKIDSLLETIEKEIEEAKIQILKYDASEGDIKYIGVQKIDRNNVNFPYIDKLKDRTFICFEHNRMASPYSFAYDKKIGDIFMKGEAGQVYWLSNGNQILNPIKIDSEEKINVKENNIEKDKVKVNISPEEARQSALELYLKRNPEVIKEDIAVGNVTGIGQNNEYMVCFAGYIDDEKIIAGKTMAEYYVNVTTGEIRVLWD